VVSIRNRRGACHRLGPRTAGVSLASFCPVIAPEPSDFAGNGDFFGFKETFQGPEASKS
jgi:hypothetical protein